MINMITIEYKNINNVLRALAKSPKYMRDHINDAIKRSIYKIQYTAIPLTPVDTGALRGSEEKGVEFRDFYGHIFPDIEYATYVHEGTSRMTSRPFLKDAMDQEAGEVKRIFEEEIGKSLTAIAKDAE